VIDGLAAGQSAAGVDIGAAAAPAAEPALRESENAGEAERPN
jgi:hypothetical protein